MNMNEPLTTAQQDELLTTLKTRFEKHHERHEGVRWDGLQAKLTAAPELLLSLYLMEQSGGEPDVVYYDEKENTYTFFDCSAESPTGRRSLCYDQAALDGRKQNKPANSAVNMAEEMGIQMLDEDQYRLLAQWGQFDQKTSSWILTPPEIRQLGGALFCDYRYHHVFTYHNGADSYYSARGFRGFVVV
ncbi:MAG: DUF4256 domain-containing protein [Lachnospiraceae bacterium]|nr:DUF4256 domain-containing protein [Lachnospiraceae bacterium]